MGAVTGSIHGNRQFLAALKKDLSQILDPSEKGISLEEKLNRLNAQNQELRKIFDESNNRLGEQKTRILTLNSQITIKQENSPPCTKVCDFFRSFTFAGYCKVHLPLLSEDQVRQLVEVIKKETPTRESRYSARVETSECSEPRYYGTVTYVKVKREAGYANLCKLLKQLHEGKPNCLSSFHGLTEENIRALLYRFVNFGNEK